MPNFKSIAVVVDIKASARYCDPDCPFMRKDLVAPGVEDVKCSLFKEELAFKGTACLRLARCKYAEVESIRPVLR